MENLKASFGSINSLELLLTAALLLIPVGRYFAMFLVTVLSLRIKLSSTFNSATHSIVIFFPE